MKYLLADIKREVKQIQFEWDQELSRLGKDLRITFPWEITTLLIKCFDEILFHNIDLSSMSFLESHIKSLEGTSSSYHKVLEENRSLYNQVIDLKGT